MTPEERVTALATLCRELLQEFHGQRASDGPPVMTATLPVNDFTARMNRLAELEREDT